MDRKSWIEDNGQEIMDRKTEARNELWRLIWTLRTSKKSRFPMLIRDCTRCIFLTMEKYFVSRSGGLKAHIKLVSSLYSESSLRGALWISFYMELEQLPSVGKLWISPRHGVRTVTFWWGSYESAHSICASSMLMKLQVKKAMVSRHRFPMLIRDCTRCIFLTMEKYFVSRPGGLKAHIKLVSSLYSESSLRGANSYLLIGKLWISFYMELEQLPSVGKLWISPRHGVRTVTFWWGSYESAHSICASSMLMKLQVKKAMVSRHR
ncbi:hypothetical protein F2Q70_00042748 [Brassica cretica]|uniref:Uncharacterized protein n=1 Tax=Brassica cretica TaxID=69181 RepID=A0A8S9KKF7_BRACR|nr:hypothetical protein F2Q70_00042748 [Brassica cretica]